VATSVDTHEGDPGDPTRTGIWTEPSEQRLRHAPLRDLAADELAEARRRQLIDHRMFEVEAARRIRAWA
jgi:hypothetical protein